MDDESPLLDSLYEAAVLPDRWPAVIDQVAAAAGAAGGIVFAANQRFSGWRASERLSRTGTSFFEDGWVSRNARTPLIIALEHPGFLRDSDVFSDADLAADPMQAQLLLPAGLGREVATMIAAPSGDKIVFSLHRSFGEGRYPDETVRRLDRLRPHIARATLLSARLGLDRMRAAVELLDTVGLAAAVLGRRGIVLASNRLLDTAPQLHPLAFSRLGLRPAGAQRRFDGAIARLEQGIMNQTLSLLLAAEDEAPDAVLHIVPLRREGRDLLSGAEAIVVVTAGGAGAVPSADLLHGLFDLTAGEARVARGLMGGSVQQVAAAASVSVETVRTQLKAVLRKTGTHRQSGLVALLTRLSFVDGDRAGAARAAGQAGHDNRLEV